MNTQLTTSDPVAESKNKRTAGRLIQLLVLPLLLFFANWIPRVAGLDVFVTADEYDWVQRTVNFASALARQSWVETFQYEHPAVTTLWLGAIGALQQMPGFAQKALLDPEPYKRPLEFWTMAELGVTPLQVLVAGRWWVVLAIAITTTVAYFPLRRLLGTAVAVVGLLFIAWSPMAVGFSRQLQPDGLVASASFASLAFFLGWLYGGRRARDLVISGILMGLGWLTKTPAAFLVPAGAVLIGIELVRQSRRRGQAEAAGGAGSWRQLVWGFVGWGIVASLTFFVLWPAMWVDPFGTFGKMYARMVEYSAGHTNPNYFFGQALYDPGPIFYPVAYLFRITPAILVGLVAAAVAAWRRYPPLKRTEARRAGLGLLIFTLVFTGLMTVIGKKFDRYLLPAFLPLDILAAAGWVAMAQGAAFWVRARRARADAEEPGGGSGGRAWAVAAGVAVLVLALVFLHGIFTARTYPYYITYYNPLLGGSRVAEDAMFVGWGEGLEEAAAWLNEQPNADNLHVVSWYAEGPLSYYFRGKKITVSYGSRMPFVDVDYVVLYINQIQRDIPTKTVIDYFRNQTPVFETARDGFVLARVYDMHAILDKLAAEAPPVQDVPAAVKWPDLELTGLRTLPAVAIPAALPVELSFTGNVGGERKVSLRLISADGTLVAQRDVPVEEEVTVQLYVPPDALPGPYDLVLLVYDGETMDPIPTVEGAELVTLANLAVGEGGTPPP